MYTGANLIVLFIAMLAALLLLVMGTIFCQDGMSNCKEIEISNETKRKRRSFWLVTWMMFLVLVALAIVLSL